MRFRVAVLVLLIAAGGAAETALSQARDPNALPRYYSLRSDDVNLRTGPGMQYPVDWVFKRRSLPVEVVAEFETWRRIRDIEGTEGWVHQSMLSTRRTVLVTDEVRTLQARPDPAAPTIAMVEPGVVATLNQCRAQWCNIEAGGYRGWLPRSYFWGLYPGENPR